MVQQSPTASEIRDRLAAIAGDVSPSLKEAIAATPPVTLVPQRELPFPDRLCRAIAGQQLSVRAAAAIWQRLVDSTKGESLVEYIAAAPPEALRTCGLSSAKAKAMGAIAAATLAGKLDGNKLGELGHEERSQRLTAIWGVGQWTADMMGIFYFGDADIWPDGDNAARKTLERLTSPRRKTVRTAARFAPYRSYLALYMWRQVNATPN